MGGVGRWCGSFDEFLALSPHVERLLRSIGRLSWEGPGRLDVKVAADPDPQCIGCVAIRSINVLGERIRRVLCLSWGLYAHF